MHPSASRRTHFNPRTREGCDAASAHHRLDDLQISIHAPVKGATNLKGYGFPPKYDFNPRTREGCDLRLRKRWEMIRDDFNPRTREGCDQTSDRFLKIESIISIHAPVKGATCSVVTLNGSLLSADISIHAPVKGATFSITSAISRKSSFQSTHP